MRHRSIVILLALAACRPDDPVVIETNTPPSTPSILISPSSAMTDEDLVVVFTAEASDTDGDTVSYRYLWSVDGHVRTDLTSDTVSASETMKGQSWSVTVTPTDGTADGGPATAEAVIVNTPPSATVVVDPEAPEVTDEVVATAAGDDRDGDLVTFTFAWTVDGEATEFTDATLPAGVATRGETWTVTATPWDDEEAGAPVEASVMFDNSAPEVAAVTVTPAPATEGDTLVATVEGVTDEDADTVALDYAWYVDGALVQDGASPTLGAESFAKHQSVEVEVTPNDGFTNGDSVRSAPVSIEDSAPSIDEVTVDPATAYEASTLVCIPAGYADIDGDAAVYLYTWTVDGAVVAATETLDGVQFDKGASVACAVTPNDGEADGATVWSEAVTVLNTAPSLSIATLSNRSPTESDTVSVNLTGAADDDGDAIAYTYNWYVNGALKATTSTLGSSFFAKGDTIQVEVTPWDGTDYGAPVWSDTGVATNSAPTTTAVSLSPTTAYTNDVLTASASTSDADGDTISVTYTWYVNGTAITATGSTLDGAVHFSKADLVYVVATASDGSASSAGLTSASVTIRNTAPTKPVVAISPTDPQSTDDLVCDVVTPSTDADGDIVSYSYAWDVDGVDAGIASDTVPASDTTVGDAWTCTVVADDGDDVSAEATDTVSIGGCYALDFDGSNDYVRVPASADFSYGSAFSAEAWVYAASGVGYQRIVGHDHVMGWHLDLESSHTVRFQLNNSASEQATATLSLGAWHHVAGVYNSGAISIYVDGVLAGTGTGSSPGASYTSRDVSLGGDSYWTTDYPWAGQIGPTRISSNARYSASFTPEWGWSDDANTVALWNHDEGSGTTLGDDSGNGHAGTISGAVWTPVVCP